MTVGGWTVRRITTDLAAPPNGDPATATSIDWRLGATPPSSILPIWTADA
jgi:hypothetical protein